MLRQRKQFIIRRKKIGRDFESGKRDEKEENKFKQWIRCCLNQYSWQCILIFVADREQERGDQLCKFDVPNFGD